jgi:hypothetical protein
MILQIIPHRPHPNVLFEVVFHNLPDSLPLPSFWANQVNALTVDNLDIPEHVHTFDKAASIVSLLKHVTFDLPGLIVNCLFIDGSSEEWPMTESSCVRMLRNVIDDVNKCSAQQREQRAREQEEEKKLSLISPPASVKKSHKKQRSLLRSFVAYVPTFLMLVTTLTELPYRTVQTVLPISYGHQKQATIDPPTAPPSNDESSFVDPKLLRRRARATLVDAFRRYVQTELRIRMPDGGFYTWILQSMLQRRTVQMELFVRSSTNVEIPIFLADHRTSGSYLSSPSDTPLPTLVSSEDDGDVDTDTDGSSLRTPSSNLSHFTFNPVSESTLSSTPPTQLDNIAPEDQQECKYLIESCDRLRQLIVLANARQLHWDNDKSQRDIMLEIRGRRRAWLNKSLVGGSVARNMEVGFAMPFQGSRLGQASWSAEEYEYAPISDWDTVVSCYETAESRHPRKWSKRTEKADGWLFPVYQEELPIEESFEVELDEWNASSHDQTPLYSALEAGRIRPRVRTQSMRAEKVSPIEHLADSCDTVQYPHRKPSIEDTREDELVTTMNLLRLEANIRQYPAIADMVDVAPLECY